MELKTWEEVKDQLAQPFPASAISWRAGSTSRDKKRAQALPYAEPRVYEDRLNELLGENWECRFAPWGEQRVTCTVVLHLKADDGTQVSIRRDSTGEFDSGDKIAQGTTAEAQAFKRACVKFGLGRYLYDIPITWVGYDQEKRQLTETPPMPAQYMPTGQNTQKAAPAPQRAAQKPQQAPKPADKAAEPLLSQKRATAMYGELDKLGFDRPAISLLAEETIGRAVTDLATVTETEALELWNEARRRPKAKPPEKLTPGQMMTLKRQMTEKGYPPESPQLQKLMAEVLNGTQGSLDDLSRDETQVLWAAVQDAAKGKKKAA